MILNKVFVRHSHRTLRIRPVGDLQLGEKGFRKDLWEQWKREALEDKDSLILGMGDYTDRFRPTIDKKLRHALLDDNGAHSEFDDLIMKEMQGIAEELKPFRHRIIGLHTGHHCHQFLGGGNSDTYLSQLLKVKYLDFFAGTRLIWSRGNGGGDTHSIDIISTHGCGGAKLVYSDMAKFNDLVYSWDADIYIRGHSTKVYCANFHPLTKLTYDSKSGVMGTRPKHRLIVNTGGFMDGYVEGHSSYVERSNMPPAALGYAVIELHLESKHNRLQIRGQGITG